MEKQSRMTMVMAAMVVLGLAACEKTEVVPSGTYEGEIVKVEAGKREIYVESNGKKLELYFTKETQLQKDGKEANFDVLAKGQKVAVTLETVGKRLDPKKVVILDGSANDAK